MEKLLDPNLSDADFVVLLDQIIQLFHTSQNGEERKVAQSVLTQLMEVPDAWMRCDKVLDNPSSSSYAKFYALQILGDMVKYRWKTLSRETCVSIRDYIVGKIISISSDEETLHKEQVYIQKLDVVLVQIVKQEWPQQWRSFMSEIVGASRTSTSQCENNLRILSLLSEEVFQFSAGQMTQDKTIKLKNQFTDEFSQVFQLCQFVFDQSSNLQTRPSLLVSTLQTLEKFLAWIPLGYIFETPLIETLISFMPSPDLRNHALKCLVEIGSLAVGNMYDERFRTLYLSFMQVLTAVVPPETNIADAYENADDDTQAFVMDLALFFSGFFKSHLQGLGFEDVEMKEALKLGLQYMLKISTVSNIEIFKTCVDWWHMFTKELYESSRAVVSGLNMVSFAHQVDAKGESLYADILSELRQVMISRMAKPEEVLIVEDENGELIRETSKDTDAIALYKTMKETLVYLTHLSTVDTERIMLRKLADQMLGSNWSWNSLNTLCWAIGSISGAMGEAEEKKFLVTVIKDLLQLCEMTRGKDNKAVVASNIMYVVGQYPRFLRAHWKFLKTVVNKQFEFMHETHPGVQDMACDTFLKIAQKCRRKFIVTQPQETKPFIDEMLDNLPEIIAELELHQIHSFYESCGCILAEQENPEICERLTAKLFQLPNESWKVLVGHALENEQSLRNVETMKNLINILKTNTRVARSLGQPYFSQLKKIFTDMLRFYIVYSELLSKMVQEGGPHATRSVDARNMRALKKEVLRVLEAFFAHERGSNKELVASTIIEPMTEPILGDYYNSVPDARDAEVLSLFAQIITFTGGLPIGAIRMIFKSLFACTLDMIKNNFEDYPDARLNFFKLLQAINRYNFPALFQLDDNQNEAEANFMLVINAIIWAFKHTERNVAETGLVLAEELLANVDKSIYVDYFYKTCFRLILNDILSVLTDTLHRSGFKFQAQILMHLLSVAASGKVKDPMWDANRPEEAAGAGDPPSNRNFVVWHLTSVLTNAFPNMTINQVQSIVGKLFESLGHEKLFKSHLRDFLVETKEFRSGDNAELYDEERQVELENQKRLEEERLKRTPGLMAPIAVDDNMSEL